MKILLLDREKWIGTILFSLIYDKSMKILLECDDCDENWTTGTILSMHPCWIEKFNFEFNSIWIYIIDDD